MVHNYAGKPGTLTEFEYTIFIAIGLIPPKEEPGSGENKFCDAQLKEKACLLVPDDAAVDEKPSGHIGPLQQ